MASKPLELTTKVVLIPASEKLRKVREARLAAQQPYFDAVTAYIAERLNANDTYRLPITDENIIEQVDAAGMSNVKKWLNKSGYTLVSVMRNQRVLYIKEL